MEIAGEGLSLLALQGHFNGTSTALQLRLNGTSMELQWHFNGTKKLFLVWLVWIIFYGILQIILKCEIRIGDPTMRIVDTADCIY